jgi:dynein heavy chain
MDSWTAYLYKIDILLQDALFTCCVNSLENIKTALADPSYAPVLKIRILLKKNEIVYEPNVENLERVIKRVRAEVIKPLYIMPRISMRFHVAPETSKAYHEQFLIDPLCVDAKARIKQALSFNIDLLDSYKTKWTVFKPFWIVKKDEFIGCFGTKNLTAESFQTNIEKFDELLNQLSTQEDAFLTGAIEIDARDLKSKLTNHLSEWQSLYIDFLRTITYGKITDFVTYIDQNLAALHDEPPNLHVLIVYEAKYLQCVDEMPSKQDEMKHILDFFNILEKYAPELPEKIHNFRNNVQKMWAKYIRELKEIGDLIEKYREQFKLALTNETDELRREAEDVMEKINVEAPMTSDW